MSEQRGEEFRYQARGGLAPDEVRRLSAISPLRSSLSLAQTFALAAGSLAAAVMTRHPLVVAAALVGVAAAQHGLAVLAHESAHYRLYKTRWINDLAGKLCAAPLSLSMITYRLIHRIHHNHLYQPVDPDLALMAGYPRGRAYLAKKLLKDLSGVTTFKNYLYFFGKPPTEWSPLDDTSPALRRAARRDQRAVLVVQALLLAGTIATGGWRWYLLLWLLPLVTLLQAILRLRAVLEHGAVPGAAAAQPTPLTAARTNFAPFYLRWILFPHHVHYHIEHHLYPSVPHYHLAECHRLLRAAGTLDGAEVVPKLRTALARIFAARPTAA